MHILLVFVKSSFTLQNVYTDFKRDTAKIAYDFSKSIEKRFLFSLSTWLNGDFISLLRGKWFYASVFYIVLGGLIRF